MCRWIAYRGETIALEHYVTAPSHSLIEQSIRALESTASINGDGFGLGWYGDHPEPGLYRELRPAWSDENLRYLCRHLRSRLFFAHVRAATGTAITRQNCHPFVCGRWMFMHNGLDRQLGPAAPQSRSAGARMNSIRCGSGRPIRRPRSWPSWEPGADRDPIGATERVLEVLTNMVTTDGLREPLRFTAALADGQHLYAFRYAANDNANTLYYRTVDEDVVVVSEPLDKDQDIWNPVPTNHMLIARAGKPVELRPMFAAQRIAAE